MKKVSDNNPFGQTVHKKLKYLLPLALVFLFLIGCSSPVQKDLLNYANNHIVPIQKEESEIVDAYSNVTGDNAKTDADLYAVLEEIIPKYSAFIEKLEKIRPETPEVREAHEMYIAASNKQYTAMTQIKLSIETNDQNLIVEANDKLAEARSGMRAFNDKIKELKEKHKVVDK